MSSQEFKDVKSAVKSLKAVAEALHTPFDTSELDRAVRALERAVGGSSDGSSESKPKSEGPFPKAEERKPVGVPKDSEK
jgi:DNA-binding response OmpR family regulator